MPWIWIALCAKACIGIALIARLLALNLHGVCRVFCIFVLYESLCSSLILVQHYLTVPTLNYNLEWLVLMAPSWIMNLWMVYAVLDAVLARLPGILRFSRKLLNYTFVAAVVVALITAKPEFAAKANPAYHGWLDLAVSTGQVLERVIATIVLLEMLAILGFVLWFPIRIPRNLVVFSLGLVFFFFWRNILMLAEEFLPTETGRQWASTASMLVLAGCFVYWALRLTRAGESIEVSLGHGWRQGDQKKLLAQLEAMNASLLRDTGAKRGERSVHVGEN
jgi:hypothetical protein